MIINFNNKVSSLCHYHRHKFHKTFVPLSFVFNKKTVQTDKSQNNVLGLKLTKINVS